MPAPLLAIENLRVVFHGDRGRRTVAVDGVDLSVARGSTLGLVGESGCGKSVTSLAVMGLLPKASAEVSGAVTFDGIGLLDLPDRELRDLRGDRLAMIFQEPMTSLNPSYRRSTRPLRCCAAPASRRRKSASTTIRTSFPAACASAP